MSISVCTPIPSCAYKYCAQLCLLACFIYLHIYRYILYIHTLNSSFSLLSLVFFFFFPFFSGPRKQRTHHTHVHAHEFGIFFPSFPPFFLPSHFSIFRLFFLSFQRPPFFHIPYFISPPILSLPQQPPRLLSSFPDLCFPPANSSN